MNDSRYDILFEPVQIGPKVTKNRFYQVPHCNGSGHRYPQAMATMRGVKAEGGWGVVCTEECEIHPSSDLSGFVEMRLWDDRDLPVHQLMVDKVHAHDALAGIQLTHTGKESGNRFTRMPAMSPSIAAGAWGDPLQAPAMSKKDIRTLRTWYRDAAVRAMKAGYDLIYVYAGHNGTILSHFLQPRYNHRTDEYGGSLENRARLLREVLEETIEAVGDRCAVALRFAVHEFDDEHLRFDRDGRAVVELLAELPDLWDVNVSEWEHDSRASRFGEANHQEHYINFVKSVTTKPVVGVGRFTAPDTMVSMVKRGIIDLIGAARPSIADPFLPNKIRENRVEEIRECIGCNICTTGDYFSVPIRCTQNPTMGEEFRKGWHPERIDAKGSDDRVLVVGAGPAGLECTLSLAKRGYDVVLADAGAEAGGRLLVESKLPGLGEWRRVIDHRIYMINQKINVQTYLHSSLSAEDIIDYGFERIVIATGAHWRADGVGRTLHAPFSQNDGVNIYSVDDLLKGDLPDGEVVVYDDDYFYMANVLAEQLVLNGRRVTYVTSAGSLAPYTEATQEASYVHQRMLQLGIHIICNHTVENTGNGQVTLSCVYSGKHLVIEAGTLVPVSLRLPDTLLLDQLDEVENLEHRGIKSVSAIGDCYAPGTIATAVYAGHLYARQLDNEVDQAYGFKREIYFQRH